MRNVVLLWALLAIIGLSGCASQSALEELKANQQEILKSQKAILASLTIMRRIQQNLAARSGGAQIDYNKVHDIPIDSSPFKGKADAPVTIVEFSDFQCPHCSRLQPVLKQVLDEYPNEVKLVFKHYPLSTHKLARHAVRAAEAAREQGKFWEMHDLIFANSSSLTESSFTGFAEELNLDTERFIADYNSKKYEELLEYDLDAGRRSGVTGTPSLYMNGKRMQRRSFADFKAAIDRLLGN
jgi:protein-disulfide isomerase